MAKARVFLDTSALFAAIWSDQGGARMVLKLGEAAAIQVLVSSQVLDEAEHVLRRKAPQMLGLLALLLDRSGAQVVAEPDAELMHKSQMLIAHVGDARILAATWASDVDFLVTLDQEHFLSSTTPQTIVPFPIATPGDFLVWYRARLAAEQSA